MDKQLKSLRRAMQNGVFKHLSFTEAQRQNVLNEVRRSETRHRLISDDKTVLIVMNAVQHSAKHGFAILQELEQNGCFTFQGQEGGLYTLLHDLENRGILAATWETTAEYNRKYYALTSKGKKVLSKTYQQEMSDGVSLKELLEGGTA